MIKSNISIRLIDMNNFSIEREVDFRINDEIFKELNQHVKFFEERGMQFNVTSIKIKDTTQFYLWVLQRLFPEYEIQDRQSVGGGVPDFELNKLSWEDFKKKEINAGRDEINHFNGQDRWFQDAFESKPMEIFVEVKRNGDGLHNNQFNWILQNRENKIIKLLFIREDNPQGF